MEKSVYGYYYDLTKSPYEYEGKKFPSKAKLKSFHNRVNKELCRVQKVTNNDEILQSSEQLIKEIVYNEIKVKF